MESNFLRIFLWLLAAAMPLVDDAIRAKVEMNSHLNGTIDLK